MEICLHGRLTVRRLRFPCAIECEASGDSGWYGSGGHGRSLRPGRKLRLPPLTSVDLSVGEGGVLAIRLLDFPQADCMPADARKPMGLALARHVFRDPAARWSRDLLSPLVGMEPLAISRALFREGESFPHLVREQRLMRVFAGLGSGQVLDVGFAAGYGFSEVRQLDGQFSVQFDARLEQMLAALAPRPMAARPLAGRGHAAAAAMYIPLYG